MNIPTYEKKDYSYLQDAFKGLQTGAQQFQQGLSNTMTIGEREDKRAREKELIGQLKVTNEQAKTVREVAITELATDIMDALGAGDIPEARDYARSRASQYFYPFTNEELKTGNGVLRVYDQEQNKEALLNKIRMKRVNEKIKGGLQTESFTPQRTIQEPVGTVGVEDAGDVKRPLETAPTQQEMQRSAESELATQPTYMKTLPREITADDLLREFPELIGDKKFEKVLDYVGRQDVAGKQWPEGTTQEEVMRQYTQTPVPSEAGYKYAETYSKREGADDLEALKLKKIKQEIELLEKKGVTGDIKESNKQIQQLIKRKDDIAKLKLSYTLQLNRFKLAIEKLKQGQPLSERIKAGLGPNVSADPDMKELTNGVDYIQMQIENADVTDERNQFMIDRLSKGGEGSMAEASEALNKRDQKEFQDAIGYIRTKISPRTKIYWTLDRIIKDIPPKYRPIVRKQTQDFLDIGIPIQQVENWLLDREQEATK